MRCTTTGKRTLDQNNSSVVPQHGEMLTEISAEKGSCSLALPREGQIASASASPVQEIAISGNVWEALTCVPAAVGIKKAPHRDQASSRSSHGMGMSESDGPTSLHAREHLRQKTQPLPDAATTPVPPATAPVFDIAQKGR